MVAGASNAYCNPEVLMRMVRGGSPAALDRITRCYSERMLRAGTRHCRTHAEAEDAVQDALLSAAAGLASFRGDGSLEGWLLRIVARACRRMARGRKNNAALHDADEELVSVGPSPLDLTCRGELAQQLEAALLSLSVDDRLVVLLAEVEGWTAPEIAAELGLTPGAVRTRLTRIRARMRRQLDPLSAG